MSGNRTISIQTRAGGFRDRDLELSPEDARSCVTRDFLRQIWPQSDLGEQLDVSLRNGEGTREIALMADRLDQSFSDVLAEVAGTSDLAGCKFQVDFVVPHVGARAGRRPSPSVLSDRA